MSDRSSSKEGKGRTDEKKVDLVAEKPALARPPPIAPSSSSSRLPPTSHDLSPVSVTSTVSSSSGDPIATQIAQLFSLVGRLSSENAALKAQSQRHTSSIARLSAENEGLTRSKQEMIKTMEEMSKAFGSHWLWEAERRKGEEGKGRWTWSGEKYKMNSLRVDHSRPPPSLNSIPVELFNSIVSLLDPSDHLALCGVSFRLLELSSGFVYGKTTGFCSKTVVSFVAARALGLPPTRITPLLLPSDVQLSMAGFEASHFLPLSNITIHPFPVEAVVVDTSSSAALSQWSPILWILDPSRFRLFGPEETRNVIPSAPELTSDDLRFIDSWTRLRDFIGSGSSSNPLIPDENGRLALLECLHRCNPGGRIGVRLGSTFSDGRKRKTVWEKVEEKEVLAVLARGLPPDPNRSLIVLKAAVFGRDA